MSYIPLSIPNIGEDEVSFVAEAVRTGWVSSVGSYVTRFEQNLADYVGVSNAVACQNGTSGLHLALLALGVRQGDLVLAPTLTFIAAVNPIHYVGAEPVFLDCDASLCIDPKKLRAFCEQECTVRDNELYHNSTGRRIPLMVVVHVFGNMADMEAICAIADEFKMKVLEDSTEALGTKYTSGKYAGRMAGTIGDAGVYSFNGNKIITTGGGGMIVAQSIELLNTVKYLSTQAKDDELYFIHNEIGYNYRMTNVQAAIGVAQLARLEDFINNKKKNYNIYAETIREPYMLLPFRAGTRANYWMYGVCFPNMESRDAAIRELEMMQIQSRPVWGLIHKQKPYKKAICYRIDKAPEYQQRVLNVPCSSNLTEEQVRYVLQYFEGLYHR